MIRKLSHLILPVSLSVAALAATVSAADASRGFTTVFDFCSQANCADGQTPVGGVIVDSSGNLYGTTEYGGTGSANGTCNGCGTVYKVAPDGTETVLYSFCSLTDCTDGGQPQSGLVMDGSGNLYGTTVDDSLVFEIAPDGTETVLFAIYPFNEGNTRYGQASGLAIDSSGNLWGTLQAGYGTTGAVFFVSVSNQFGQFEYKFCSQPACADGYNPVGGVIIDAAGNLYGTTTQGGAYNGGTVFKLSPNGRGFTETTLYNFCSATNCTDGYLPNGQLVMNRVGDIFGTTSSGGAIGDGAAFELATNGTETVLHSFCSNLQHGRCLDGTNPVAGILKVGEKLYGTTPLGGEYQAGTVFSLGVPGETEKPIYSFGQYADGFASTPYAGVATHGGYLYGTTESGGWNGGGIVFKVGTSGAPKAH